MGRGLELALARAPGKAFHVVVWGCSARPSCPAVWRVATGLGEEESVRV